MKRLIVTLVLIAIAQVMPGAGAKQKERTWRRGIVQDTGTQRTYVGSRTTQDYYGSETSEARYVKHYMIVIEGSDRIYVTWQTPRWRWSRVFVPAVNTEIEYSISEGRFYLKPIGGQKEFRAYVEKVIVKKPPTPPAERS